LASGRSGAGGNVLSKMARRVCGSLTKELALAEITTVEAANIFMRDVTISAHNMRFAVMAGQEGSAFVASRVWI